MGVKLVGSGKYPIRKQFVQMLSQTVHAAGNYSEATRDEVCQALGVMPELLMEARLLYLERRQHSNRLEFEVRTSGHITRRLKALPKRTIGFHKAVGEVVVTAVKEEAERRQQTVNMLMTSLYYHYLMGTWEPSYIYKTWKQTRKPGETWTNNPYKIQPVDMNAVAGQVFFYRARRLNTTGSSLCRTLVMEMIQNNFARHEDMEYVSMMTMSFNIHDYPGFTHEELAMLERELEAQASEFEAKEAEKKGFTEEFEGDDDADTELD